MSTPTQGPTPGPDEDRAGTNGRKPARTVALLAGTAVALTVAAVATVLLLPAPPTTSPAVAPTPVTQQSEETASTLALPLADYKAVIPGLIAFDKTVNGAVTVGKLKSVTPVYGSDRKTPVARLDKTDFMGQLTPVVVVEERSGWWKILTPARVSLPSETGDHAPAQSAGWIPSDAVTDLQVVSARVDVDLSARTLAVTGEDGAVTTFDVGIGTAKTPTPSAVSGYLEARFVDPKQGTGDHPIQLTSLHTQTEDTPVAGGVGGVIAMHYYDTRSGAISHGCLRLSAEAVAAVNTLPVGAIVTVTP